MTRPHRASRSSTLTAYVAPRHAQLVERSGKRDALALDDAEPVFDVRDGQSMKLVPLEIAEPKGGDPARASARPLPIAEAR